MGLRMLVKIGAVAVALTAALPLAPAAAVPSGPAAAQARTVESMVGAMVRANPGARQVSADTVRLANGVEATASVRSVCRYGYLCIHDASNGGGAHWDFYKCGFVNIGNSGWGDRIRSYKNNQTLGTQSIFMNWTGSQWQAVEYSTAYDYQPRAAGASFADGIWVC